MSLLATKPLERILSESESGNKLRRSLGPISLITLGVGAIIGAGIFTLTGVVAATNAGPAILISFVLAAIGCAFAGLCYSEFQPFLPQNTGNFGAFGWSGVLAGAGAIFFAYIGFDAVSTAAQEAERPSRDMPVGIIGSLLVCTAPFILYAYVLTGMVNYRELNVAAPISLALALMHNTWISAAMNLAVLAALTSVMLVMLLGQSRVFFSMAGDGLLPRLFGEVHPRFRTPWKCNLALMVFVALFAAFAPIQVVGLMTSIGTLFAFVLVCGGIIIMRRAHPDLPQPFRTPFVPGVPILGVAVNLLLMFGLGWTNWARLIVWLVVGLIIYFAYGRFHSRIRTLSGEARSVLHKRQNGTPS